MEDKSLIRPILEALEYFKESKEELKYFYKIIDKFCACWFSKVINVHKLNNIELLLIHDLLGEYIRFEENNKRVALWLLAINRVCQNYTSDLTDAFNEIKKIDKENQGVDSTLIEPIIRQIDILDKFHKSAGRNDLGQSDVISNFIQWVLIYSTLIFPSLENKMDFYEKNTIKAMNFILLEFIKQRSNDRRMAYLIMGIVEACRQYTIQTQSIATELIIDDKKGAVIAGQEESLVAEILNKLKDETIRQINEIEIAPNDYLEKKVTELIDELNSKEERLVSVFNKYIYEATQKFLSYNEENQLTFLKTLSEYNNTKRIKDEIIYDLNKLINHLPSKTIKWFNSELQNFNSNKKKYPEKIYSELTQKKPVSKFNFFKPYIMLLVLQSLNVF